INDWPFSYRYLSEPKVLHPFPTRRSSDLPQIDLASLPFDAEEMLGRLRPWIECESPTHDAAAVDRMVDLATCDLAGVGATIERIDRKSTRLNSSHVKISYAVFCLKNKNQS